MMTKLLRPALLAFLLLSPGLRAATTTVMPFAQASSDLKPDPAARFGTLPNGFRYVIRPNREPKNRASLRLLVQAGSLFENENQRGLAHFLEHMAFNGSTHYAPDTLVEFFQRMGMNFGGDTNAYTSFDRTVYMLELPDTKDGTVAEGLKVFGDYAGGLLLLDKEIDKERGVILSEKRTRDSVDYRTYEAEYNFVLGSTLFPHRMPIGLQDIIEKSDRAPFLDFYNTWYRPERMTVVVVGDIDPAKVEPLIAAAFSGVTDRAPARPLPDLGKVALPVGLRVNFHPEAEASATEVSITSVTPYAHEVDNAASRLKYLPRELAVDMLNRRFSILAKKENAPFTRGQTDVGEEYDFYRQASVDLTCKPEQWQAALAVADQELRRALQYGFQPAELKEAVANYSNGLEQAAKTAATRRSGDIANEILGAVAEDNVFTTPESDLALFAPALAKVTPEDCAAALRDTWSAPFRYLLVSGNAVIPGDAVAAITSSYNTAHAVPVAPPDKMADATWAYTDFGPAGAVTKREHVDDLDVTLVTFANGVRLNLKKTDFEDNRIRVNVRVGTGSLTEPKDKPGLAFFASNTFSAGGLGKHSTDDLQTLLAGKTVGFGFRVGTDALSVGATTNRDDLLLQLQLITAYLTDPGYRPESLRLAQKGLDQLYTGLAHTTNGPLQLEVARLLASGDPRFGLPTKEVALSRTLDEVKTWMGPQLATGALEIALVGDLDIDTTIADVARTLGALPTRGPRPALTAERQVKFPDKPFAKEYTVPTEIPKGVIVIYWPTTDANEIHRTRRLTLLGEVFSDRLRVKVREELGGAYSPGAGSQPSDTYTNYGFMIANVTVDPAKAGEISDVVVAIANDLYRNGVTDDEVQRAKQPILTSLRETARTNAYWIGSVLARAQEKPEVLDWSRSRASDFESITKADLDALAKTYMAPDRAFRVIVLPEKK
ncbi:MAG TPA: insulinase family protein [Opitutaceae bacterium]|nr:insulinase family protein [Opitutaceae bacterium]